MFGKQTQMGRWIAAAVAIGLVWTSNVSAQKPPKPPKDDPITYTTVELTNLGSELSALNQLVDGVVEAVGFVWDDSGEIAVQRASHWLVEPSGAAVMSISPIPPLDPEATIRAVAVDVNNQGVIIGSQRDTSDPGWRPLLWPDAVSDPVALQLPGVDEKVFAVSINDEGIVIGRMYAADGTVSPVAWKVVVFVDDGGTARATLQDTITLSVPDCWPTQIVNSGNVSAIVRSGTLGDRAVRLQLAWDDRQVWELEGSGAQLFDVYSRAAGVNEAGIVCGSYRKDGQVCAFVKNLAGDLIDLPTLPGGRLRGLKYDTRNMAANGLNNASPLQVIGMASKSTTVDHQWLGDLDVLWNVRGTAVDITPDKKFGLYDINDAGWIAGTAPAVDSGVYRAVVLIPSR